jgi:hypothetical protein
LYLRDTATCSGIVCGPAEKTPGRGEIISDATSVEVARPPSGARPAPTRP